MKQIPTVFASDIDNTLTGDVDALKDLGYQLAKLREQKKLALFLTTGRTLKEVLDGLERENLPLADAIISQVGTEIYLPPFEANTEPLPEWNNRLHRQFSREKAIEFVAGIEGVEMQPAHYNTPLKVSYYLDKAPEPDKAAQQIVQRVAQNGNGYRVVWSSGRDLDILPADAGKGNAIQFLIQYLELNPQKVITAGDSGNDRSMLEAFEHGIVVANAQPELKALKEKKRDRILYFAQQPYAAGVKEGLHQFGVL